MFRNIFMTGLLGCALSASAFAGEPSANNDGDPRRRDRRHEEVVNASCVFYRDPIPAGVPPVKGAPPAVIPPALCSASVQFTTRFETGRFEDEEDEDDRGRRNRRNRFVPDFFDVVCGPAPYVGPISSFSVKRANELDLLALGPILPTFFDNGAHNRDELLLVSADDLSSQVLITNFRDEILDDLDDERLERRRRRWEDHPALLRHIVPLAPGVIPTKGGPVPAGPAGFTLDSVGGLCRINRIHSSRPFLRETGPTVTAGPVSSGPSSSAQGSAKALD